MKYLKSVETISGSVCCRIVEWGWDAFEVSIFGHGGELIARSAARLSTEQALNFIVEVSQERNVLPRFHLVRRGTARGDERKVAARSNRPESRPRP